MGEFDPLHGVRWEVPPKNSEVNKRQHKQRHDALFAITKKNRRTVAGGGLPRPFSAALRPIRTPSVSFRPEGGRRGRDPRSDRTDGAVGRGRTGHGGRYYSSRVVGGEDTLAAGPALLPPPRHRTSNVASCLQTRKSHVQDDGKTAH